ncbi:MAG: GFA family protein [Oceanospirillaceae bacterium]|nr:GFA family protein [Oceanospirillaceae bacterium]
MSELFKGSCLCGVVKFSVTAFNPQVGNCHCSMCRKFHGAAFATLVSVSNLNWSSGQSLLKDFTAANGTIRTFCSQCGSSIGFRVKGASLGAMEVAIATFDADIPVKVDAQIYTDNKANWCELQKDITAFTQGRI